MFLSEAETDRVQIRLKQHSQVCQDLSGKPRTPNGAGRYRSLIQTAAFLSDIADTLKDDAVSKREAESLVAFSVGIAYPPCIPAIDELGPISMFDLTMDTHHRGSVLIVQRVSEVV